MEFSGAGTILRRERVPFMAAVLELVAPLDTHIGLALPDDTIEIGFGLKTASRNAKPMPFSESAVWTETELLGDNED